MKVMRRTIRALIVAALALLAACDGGIFGGTLLEGVGADSAGETEPTLETKMRGIWVVGGASFLDGTGLYAQLDLYDPVTNTWYPDVAAGATGSYSPTVHGMVASVNGKLYALGGALNSTTVTSAVFEYDIAANHWTAKQGILNVGTPTPVMASAVYTDGNNIYLIGGTSTTVTGGVQTFHLKFDPAAGANGQWSNLAAYTTARSSMGAGYFDGSAAFFGGRINTGGGQTTNDIYVIASNSYTTGAEPVIQARAGAAATVYTGANGTYAFIVGGAPTFAAATAYFAPTLTGITYVAQAQSFQIYAPPGSAAVTNGKNHPAFVGGNTGIVFASAAVSPYNGSAAVDPMLYVYGGIRTGLTGTSEVWAIDADDTLAGYPAGVWVSKSNMPRPRYGHGVTAVNP